MYFQIVQEFVTLVLRNNTSIICEIGAGNLKNEGTFLGKTAKKCCFA